MSTEATTPQTDAEYFADFSAVSNSMLKVFRQSPARYNAFYVARTKEPPPPTPGMVLGSVTHALWLEPKRFGENYIVAPNCDRRTKAGKATWSEFVDAAAGKVVIEQDDYDLAKAMVAALVENPIARALRDVADPIIEKPIYWETEVGGLTIRRKGKPDMVVMAGMTEWNLCVDLKTSAAAGNGFNRQAANLGYHDQGAWYLEGCREAYDNNAPWKFLILAVDKAWPHDVFPHYLGRDWLTVGADDNAEQLTRLARCMETGEWLAPEQNTITELVMPKYLLYQGT